MILKRLIKSEYKITNSIQHIIWKSKQLITIYQHLHYILFITSSFLFVTCPVHEMSGFLAHPWNLELGIWVLDLLGASPREKRGVGLSVPSPRGANKRPCGLSSPIPCARANRLSPGFLIKSNYCLHIYICG